MIKTAVASDGFLLSFVYGEDGYELTAREFGNCAG